MENIFIIEHNHNGVEAINSRDLFSFLNNKKDFKEWIENGIDSERFIEGIDYSYIDEENSYYVTPRLAKHLCAKEDSEKGGDAIRQISACQL